MIRIADAKALKAYLDHLVNKNLVADLNLKLFDTVIKDLWNKVQHKSGVDVSYDLFYDRLTDRLFEKKRQWGAELMGVAAEQLEEHGVPHKRALEMAGPNYGALPDDISKKMVNDASKAVYKWLKGKFDDISRTMERRLKKTPETSLSKRSPETGDYDLDDIEDIASMWEDFERFDTADIPTDSEIGKMDSARDEFQSGLLEKCDKAIEKNRKDEKIQNLYKAVLRMRLMEEMPRKDVAQKLKIDPSQVTQIQKKLETLLKPSLRKLEEETGLERGEGAKGTKIPKYTKVLTNKKDSEDFKKVLKSPERTRGTQGGAAEDVLELMAEGMNYRDIADKLNVSYDTVTNVYKRYMRPQYEKWYRKQHSQIKKALLRIARALTPTGDQDYGS